MRCSLFSLTPIILGTLLFGNIGAYRMPLIADDDPNTITSRIYSEGFWDVPRSLQLEDYELGSVAVPEESRVISPTIMRLHPAPPLKPSHLHANLPLRFGRRALLSERTPKSSINLPQRFGRSREGDLAPGHAPDRAPPCPRCRRADALSATLPQRFGRRNVPVRDAIRTLAVLTRSLELPFPRDRTQDYDYKLESVQEEDKDLKSKNYIDLDEGNL